MNAARLAFDTDPDGYHRQAVGERLQRRIVEVAVAGTRSGGGLRTGGNERAALRGPDAGRELVNHLDRAGSFGRAERADARASAGTGARRRIEGSPAPTSPPELS